MEPLIKREWSREYWEIRGASAHQAGKTEGRTCASAMLLWLVVVTVSDTLSVTLTSATHVKDPPSGSLER
jgi:hypothetical protein